jgi:hypothetical protein
MKDFRHIMNHFHELEQVQFIMILIGVVANIVPSALTAKGALIANPIVNLIAGIKLSQLRAISMLKSWHA